MFNSVSVLERWVLAVCVVFATYNTSGYSYYHWVTGSDTSNWTIKLFLGLILMTVYAVFAMVMWRGMGPVGIAAGIATLTTVVWILERWNLLSLTTHNTIATVVGFMLATVIGFGLSFMHLRTRLTGQTDTRDVNQY